MDKAKKLSLQVYIAANEALIVESQVKKTSLSLFMEKIHAYGDCCMF